MDTVTPNDRLERACVEAHEKFEKLNKEEFAGIKSKLEWCIGSYQHDKNPSGLYDAGTEALNALKGFKKQKPRMVSKKLIEDLEKALKYTNGQ